MSLAAMYMHQVDALKRRVAVLEDDRAAIWTAGYLAGQRSHEHGPQPNPHAQAQPIPGYPRKEG